MWRELEVVGAQGREILIQKYYVRKNHFNKGEKILSQKMWLRTIIEASEH